MNTNDKKTWFKWDYVCTNCDSHVEMTIKSIGFPHSEVCPTCHFTLSLMSVVDATIVPITDKKEDTMLDTPLSPVELYNPNLLVTYKKIEKGEVSYVTDKVNDIEFALDQSRRNSREISAYFEREVALEELVKNAFVDSGDQGILREIAELFDFALTKDVEFIATIEISGTVTVSLTDEDALENVLSNSLNISSYDGDLDVSDYVLINCQEN